MNVKDDALLEIISDIMNYSKKSQEYEKIGNRLYINQVFKTLSEPEYLTKVIKKKEELNMSLANKMKKKNTSNKNGNNEVNQNNSIEGAIPPEQVPEDRLLAAFEKLPRVIDFVDKNKNDFLQLSISNNTHFIF